jgi:DNA polymerase III subunit delta'
VVAADELVPWLGQPLRDGLNLRSAHAVLLHGPDGNGQFQLALALAQAFLCEAAREPSMAPAACNTCASCLLFKARTHPDMVLLVPEALRESLGWAQLSAGEEPADGGAGKSKPSKEIKVDDIRAIVSAAQSTSARGKGKAVIIHPAERMNTIAANALLKTLEEPAGLSRYILSSHAPEALPPTVRSRCVSIPVALPSTESALAWLADKDVKEPEVMLAASGGRAIEALQWAASGIDATLWRSVPSRVAKGAFDAFADWPLSRLIEALQKLCHDSLCLAVGSEPRYFPRQDLAGQPDFGKLIVWAAALREIAKQAEHPWQASLKVESLVQQGQRALMRDADHENPPGHGPRERASLHSRP